MERKIEQATSEHPNVEVSQLEKQLLTKPEPAVEFDDDALYSEKKINRRQLINKLNNLNFKDLNVLVVFRHMKYDREMVRLAYPLPCHDEILSCQWADEFDFNQMVESYTFQYLHVPKGQQFLEVLPEVKSIDEKQIVFALPETCNEISSRKLQRHQCSGVTAHLIQNGAVFSGQLVDSSPSQFRVSVETTPPQNFSWIEADVPVTIIFAKENKNLYSAECRIARQDQGLKVRHFTLEPTHRQIHRFPAREFRSSRHKLTPPPDAVFEHPFFGKTVTLKVQDISGTGFSVFEEQSSAVLLPGLIIPKLDLVFGDGTIFRCLAQVVYCNPLGEGRVPMVRCGLTILDMAVKDHIRLLGLMHQTTDPSTYICNRVDIDALWDFFFDTGFIYPEKYEFIKANKAKIKATYEKLYNSNPSVAVHFIYQQNGRILAHAGILRLFESSWLLHHHAAVRSVSNRGGLTVLNQSGRFIHESHRLHTMKMDYVMCYFRPENKFPSHVFGGATRNINDPAICSVDTFAYFHHRVNKTNPPGNDHLPDHWELDKVTHEDLLNLQTFYEKRAGGLMLKGLHLSPERFDCSSMIEAYQDIGLKRERHLFALRYRAKLCAVVMANVSELGLNMSDLTNAVTFIAVDGNILTPEVYTTVIHHIAHLYETEEIPILLYPLQEASHIGINAEKSYALWVYDTHDIDPYFRYLKRLLKFIQY
ncbi:MAG: hypothetical protein M0036_05400 [Desulfobacteraceae bacterium]|nr:hypothetical protein [Desulfobacteraceae bacterium]